MTHRAAVTCDRIKCDGVSSIDVEGKNCAEHRNLGFSCFTNHVTKSGVNAVTILRVTGVIKISSRKNIRSIILLSTAGVDSMATGGQRHIHISESSYYNHSTH